jgi:hypothetical protein
MGECTALGQTREEALERAKSLLAKRFSKPRESDAVTFNMVNAAAELGGMISREGVVRVRVDLDVAGA